MKNVIFVDCAEGAAAPLVPCPKPQTVWKRESSCCQIAGYYDDVEQHQADQCGLRYIEPKNVVHGCMRTLLNFGSDKSIRTILLQKSIYRAPMLLFIG